MPIPILDEIISYGKVGWALISGLWKWQRRQRRRLTPQEKLELRLKWKPEIEKWRAQQRKENLDDDVLIRDIKRLDHYPDVRKGKGISAWFRGGLIYTYERGIMVGLSWEELKFTDDEKLRFCNRNEAGDITLMRTGFIPYEGIEKIDWDGDRYYSEPHIFCYFDQLRNQPYERIAFCERRENPHWTYWVEIADYDAVRKLSKKLGVQRY